MIEPNCPNFRNAHALGRGWSEDQAVRAWRAGRGTSQEAPRSFPGAERCRQPLTRGAILWNYPPGRRGGTGPWPHNMRGPTLCGAAPPLAQACGPTICEAPLYAVPLPPSDYIALDIRFGGERHRIFQGRAYSRVTGRCHPPFPQGTSFVPSVC